MNNEPKTLSEAFENLGNAFGALGRDIAKAHEPLPAKTLIWAYITAFLVIDVLITILTGDY